jgi:hypothetical protein
MSRREAWVSAAAVFAFALLVRAWVAANVTFPQPEDTAYYVDVARNLLAGHGLTADAIWSYGTPPLTFNPPRPAFEVWLPLATFLDALPMAILGSTFAAAQVASLLVGSLVAVLGWRLAADVAEELELPPARARSLAIGTGLAAGVYLPLALGSAQPDSTMPFAALVLASVLVAGRILRAIVVLPEPEVARRKLPSPRQRRRGRQLAAATANLAAASASASVSARHDRGGHHSRALPLHLDRAATRLLVGLGVLLGLTALTRNEALWLAIVWAVLAWRATSPAGRWTRRLRAAAPLIGIPALVSIAIYLPWLVRDALVFGNPLPGQALSNALFLDGRDVFAWLEPPTLERYLNAGLGTLLGLRVTGFLHNLGSVLLLLGMPISALGLIGLPWTARVRALGPLVGFAVVTFLVATLVFPVATTWGTFLHAAGAIHVLILISALLVLDRIVERVRISREWTRPVAWLGPAAAIAGSLLLTVALIPPEGNAGRDIQARYAALPGALAQAGAPLPTDGSPVITDFPIWLATEDGVHTLALPNERQAEVLDLATRFGAKLLIVDANNEGLWPEVLDPEEPGSECFKPIDLPVNLDGPLGNTLAFQIVCAGGTPGTP